MKMTFLIARSRSVRKIRSRSTAKPVGCSSGTPKMLALDQESCAAEGPVGTESGTLETITFQVADDEVTPSSRDRKSTRLNSSHLGISYAVFCLKKKNTTR